MASYIVEISNFATFLQAYRALVARAVEQGIQPGATTDDVPGDRLNQVVQSLAHRQNASVKWFYYCDNQRGNTIRIYDRPLRNANPDLFYDREGGETFVVLRSREVGSAGEALKVEILGLFDRSVKTSELPRRLGNPPGRMVDRVPRDPDARCALFESLNSR